MKIAQLNFDSFKINGQLNERAPRVINNIYKNFPLDNNSSNSLPICILSVNNKELFASDPSLIESKNGLTFDSDSIISTANSYLKFKSEIFNNLNDFKIELEVSFDNITDKETILELSDSVSKKAGLLIYKENRYINIEMDQSLATSDKINNKFIYPVNNIGDINKNQTVKITIERNRGVLSTLIDNYFKKIYNVYGKLTINTNKFCCFKGKTKSIKIWTFEYLFPENSKFISELGIYGTSAAKNINNSNLNICGAKERVSLKDTFNVLNNYKLKQLSIKCEDEADRIAINKGTGHYGIQSDSIRLAAKSYCAFIIYKPINIKADLVMDSSMTGWTSYSSIELENGYYMTYMYITNTAAATAKIAFTSKYANVATTDYVNFLVSPIIVLEEVNVPTNLFLGASESSNIVIPNSDNLLKMINNNIDHFTIAFDMTICAHTTSTKTPFILSLNPWASEYKNDWIGIYKGAEWNNGNTLTMGCMVKNQKGSDSYVTVSDCNKYLGHKLYCAISYSKNDKRIIYVVYDKTIKSYLIKKVIDNPLLNFTGFSSASLSAYSQTLINNLTIYKKALSLTEMENNYVDKFSLDKEGNLSVKKISERSLVNQSKEYYFPLDSSTASITGKIDVTNNQVQPSYVDGGTLVGTYKGLLVDLMNAYATNDLYTLNGMDKYLNSDAKIMFGWQPNTPDLTKGFIPKFVKEGPSNNLCLKMINYNNEFYNNPWMAASRKIAPKEFGLMSSLKIGDNFSTFFKARSNIPTSLSIGIFATDKNGTKRWIYKKEISISTTWQSYTVKFTIDDNIDLSKDIYFEFETHLNSIVWVSDAIIGKTDFDVTPDVALSLKQDNSKLLYNLPLNWSLPWTIRYWKKPISSEHNNEYNLDSLGIGGKSAYIYWGHYVDKNKVILLSNDSASVININDEDYYNHWLFHEIKYDGSTIYSKIVGEKINLSWKKNIKLTANAFNNESQNFMLGGYNYDNKMSVSCSIFKDLEVSQYYKTDEDFKVKLSYKNNDLNCRCNFSDIPIS